MKPPEADKARPVQGLGGNQTIEADAPNLPIGKVAVNVEFREWLKLFTALMDTAVGEVGR